MIQMTWWCCVLILSSSSSSLRSMWTTSATSPWPWSRQIAMMVWCSKWVQWFQWLDDLMLRWFKWSKLLDGAVNLREMVHLAGWEYLIWSVWSYHFVIFWEPFLSFECGLKCSQLWAFWGVQLWLTGGPITTAHLPLSSWYCRSTVPQCYPGKLLYYSLLVVFCVLVLQIAASIPIEATILLFN